MEIERNLEWAEMINKFTVCTNFYGTYASFKTGPIDVHLFWVAYRH